MPYVQDGPGGDPEFSHSPLGRLFGHDGPARPAKIKKCATVAGGVAFLIAAAVIVLVLVGCHGEGGAYCSMYGHPEPWLRKIYAVHEGEYGDLLFGCAQLVLILVLLASPTVRRLFSKRWCCWWRPRRGWHWMLLLLLVIIPPIGGLLNRIRGGWLGDNGWIDMASSEGDVISRITLSSGTLMLVTVLSGGNLPLGLVYFFWMWWAEMLGWGCYFGMAHGSQPKPGTHGDCAGLDRHGMYDWLLGTTVAAWPHARRLRRDWVGMWLRGLNWLGPPGLATAAAGYGTAVIACGACLPVIYNADVWFITDQWMDNHHFSTGSPLGELIWGMFAWLAILVTFLGQRQEPDDSQTPAADRAAVERLLPQAAVVHVQGAATAAHIRPPSVTRSDEPIVVSHTIWRGPSTRPSLPSGGLLASGWVGLMPAAARSVPQRLFSLLERLIWVVGVLQSLCTIVLCGIVAFENGRQVALMCVAGALVVATVVAPSFARTWVSLRNELHQETDPRSLA